MEKTCKLWNPVLPTMLGATLQKLFFNSLLQIVIVNTRGGLEILEMYILEKPS